MRLICLNLRYGTADDGPNAWPHRRERLFTLLRELDADLMCFQEALAFQVDELAAAFPGYGWVGVGRDDGARSGEFAPIFYRGLTLIEARTIWLSDSPSEPGSMGWGARHARICTMAAFDGISVANLHLDHECELARLEGCRLVLREMPADLICGDFNAPPDEACIDQMLAAGYLDLGRDAGGTFNNFEPAAPDAQRIDYVFGHVEPRATRVVREPLVSDHWPAVVDL